MSLRQALVWMLLAAIVASGVALFLKNFEQATEKVHTGLRGEALRNPWLAAQRLTVRMGGSARQIVALPDLRTLDPASTLVMPARRQVLSPSLRQSIASFVTQGGTLLVEAEPVGLPDPLLDLLGVQRFAVNAGTAGKPCKDDEPFEVVLPHHEAAARVHLGRHMRLAARDPVWSYDGGCGTALLVLERGEGLVIAVNDLHFAANRGIGQAQHAQFFWDLAAAGGDAPVIQFFHRPGKLPLSGWLREHAWAPLAGLALLVALWLWSVAPRFGPVAPDPVRDRRRLLDHLRASGRFLWTNGGAPRMLEAARDACLRRIARAHPDFLAASDAERPQRLAELLGWPEARARRLLAPASAGRMAEFMDIVALYQSVHEHFARKARANPGKPR
ncbi:MAG TPA: DUF4350 domain-containing protein [Burkholderiales bacterium]|nr:DUF4350 domain-containing protein [Burkholderiales bacterium]